MHACHETRDRHNLSITSWHLKKKKPYLICFVDDDYQSIEERELTDKLATLNAACAKANAEVAEAVRLSAETESTAVKVR